MEDEVKEHKNETLADWTKDEKYDLLQALKEYGSYRIDDIKNTVTTKTEEEIIAAIEYYKKKALAHPTMKHKKLKRVNNFPGTPLASWAKCLLDTHGFEELQTDTATALRLIAEFEEKPPGVCTEKFDFKKIYHVLADALEGKPIQNNKQNLALFDKCVVETALTSKDFMKSTAYKNLLNTINIYEKSNDFSKPTTDKELLNLRHLVAQKKYNPLNIPENYLKASSHTP